MLILQAAVAIKCFGVSCGYLIIVGDLMPEASEQLGGHKLLLNRELWIAIAFTIVFPIAMLNSLEKLKFTSTMSVFFISFVTLMIILFAFHLDSLDACEDIDPTEDCVGERLMWNDASYDVLSVLSIFVFSFTCHQVSTVTGGRGYHWWCLVCVCGII